MGEILADCMSVSEKSIFRFCFRFSFLDTSAHALVMTMSPLVISKALPPCHTERSEVSKNAESTTESKRDFSPFSKAQNDKGGTAQNDKGERTQNDKGEGKRLSMTKEKGLKMTRIEIFRLLRKLKMTMYFIMTKA